ncbi:MAG: hypothetical protein ACT4OJ_12055 [Bacteroidota bacterium]
MKRILLSIMAGSFLLTGCLETTQEITLKEDGSGVLNTTSDMSSLLTVAKNMSGDEQMEKMGGEKKDTSISLASLSDSIPGLTTEEKALLSKGMLRMKMDLKESQFLAEMNFPFTELNEIAAYNRLTGKLMTNLIKGQMKESPMGGGMGGDMPDPSSFDDYYKLSYEKGGLKKSLDKEKYASASSDEYLNGLKQAASMGIPVSSTWVINLPRPAEKVEGKSAKLSVDKMKVTVKADLDDFFDDPEKLEFKIKY